MRPRARGLVARAPGKGRGRAETACPRLSVRRAGSTPMTGIVPFSSRQNGEWPALWSRVPMDGCDWARRPPLDAIAFPCRCPVPKAHSRLRPRCARRGAGAFRPAPAASAREAPASNATTLASFSGECGPWLVTNTGSMPEPHARRPQAGPTWARGRARPPSPVSGWSHRLLVGHGIVSWQAMSMRGLKTQPRAIVFHPMVTSPSIALQTSSPTGYTLWTLAWGNAFGWKDACST